jgi:hypothetical protein
MDTVRERERAFRRVQALARQLALDILAEEHEDLEPFEEVNVRSYARTVRGRVQRVRAHRRRNRLARRRASLAAKTRARSTDEDLIFNLEHFLQNRDPRATVFTDEIARRIEKGRDPDGQLAMARDHMLDLYGPLPPENYSGSMAEKREWAKRQLRQNFSRTLPLRDDREIPAAVEMAVRIGDQDLIDAAAVEARKRAAGMPNDRRQRDLFLIQVQATGEQYGKDLGLAEGRLKTEFDAFQAALRVWTNRKMPGAVEPKEIVKHNNKSRDEFGPLVWREAYARARRAHKDRFVAGEESAAQLFASVIQDEMFGDGRRRRGY